MNATLTQVADLSGKAVTVAKCPYCKEEIQADALKCRHCGEILNREEYSKSTGGTPLQKAISRVKAFSPLTHVGSACTLFFGILLFTTITYRWWIVLPLAIGGIIALRRQMKVVSGLENTVCVVGSWTAVALLLVRDVFISNRICTVVDGIAGIADAFKGL